MTEPELIKTMEAFQTLLKDNPRVVVDFFADWCGPCKMISPKFKELAGTYTSVKFAKVDVEDASEVSEDCKISAMPTFQFYKDGKQVAEMKGANAAKLEEELKNLAG
ncbi:thioredoxin-like [Diadema antillarum]|uniref:thioredoxin-like n=1 Tax=Diadema antillarum TaxID=105358 RepID=UPI003A879AFD